MAEERGAFGFVVTGCGQRWLAEAGEGERPRLQLRQRTTGFADRPAGLGHAGELVRVGLPDGQRVLEIDLAGGIAWLCGPEGLSDDLLVQPYLGFAAALASRLLGRDVLHAGSFVVDDGAWLLCAGPGGGKSTLLAELSAAGMAVLADDIAVIDDHHVHRGPRCLDLRDPANAPGPLARVRHGSRWRATLPPAPAAPPLRGFVHLSFAPTLAIGTVSVARRMEMIAAHRVFSQIPADPSATLIAGSLPAFELQRPLHLDQLPSSAALLLEHLGALA